MLLEAHAESVTENLKSKKKIKIIYIAPSKYLFVESPKRSTSKRCDIISYKINKPILVNFNHTPRLFLVFLFYNLVKMTINT